MPPRDYEVGYGKPPSATRFQLGQSGNPRGRRKGSKNLAQLIEHELDKRLVVNENGKRKPITKRQAVAKQLVNKAACGYQKSIPLIITESRQKDMDADKAPR